IQGDAPAWIHNAPAPHQATDAKTAAALRGMMEDVMIEGTGKHSQLDGYTSGGKSGTAQQIDPATGRYSATRYNASFVGFAPVNNPAVTILAVLDSPVGPHHGGQVGGPIFKRVAEQVLAYLGVPHDVPSPSDVETAKNEARRRGSDVTSQDAKTDDSTRESFAASIGMTRKMEAAPIAAFAEQDFIAVPSLAGESVRGVTEECSRLGLAPTLIGNGIAIEQFPEAGTQVQRGSRVTVRFGRSAELEPVAARGSGNRGSVRTQRRR
ncbi:MAG TPA: penicillin-binding transpeptidase domain-containing protein, partial [Verrucomicrobiae bacterium]|nr:penicillin-binding transpeptidase domain-containing protein [Verrucomicrobiae bacterium]